MNFDPLHVALLALLFSIIGGLVVRLILSNRFVSCDTCQERHKDVDSKVGKLERGQSRLFGMTKALVVYHKDIPDCEKAELLSEGRD